MEAKLPGKKKRLLLHPGFRIDTWSSIEKRYLWLCGPLEEYFDVYWLVPPTSSKYSRFHKEEYRHKEPIFVTHLKKAGAQIIEADITKWNVIKNFFLIRGIYRRYEIDMVYTHFSPLGYYLEFFAKLLGVKVIRGEHIFTFQKERRYKFLKWFFWRFTTDYYIGISKSMAVHLKQSGVAKDNVYTVYNGFDFLEVPKPDHEMNRKTIIAKYGLSDDARILSCTGRIKPVKCQHTLIEMLAGLDKNVYLLLAGDVHDESYKKRLDDQIERLGLEGRVIFTGYQFNVYPLMDASEITYLPSLFEGLGNVVIESFLMEKPAIASDIPPIREIIDDGSNGYCVLGQDAEKYLAYTRELLKDPQKRQRFGTAGRKKADSLFSKDVFIRESIRSLQAAVESFDR